MILWRECEWCGNSEERVFTDSWTAMDLCLTCLGAVAQYVTNSPGEDGDNLREELERRVGPKGLG